jgi:heat shock protein HslJ
MLTRFHDLEEIHVSKISFLILAALLLTSCASGAVQTTASPIPPTEPAAPTAGPSSVAPTEPSAPPAGDLQGGTWYLETYKDAQGNQMPVLAGSQITLEFRTDGSVGGSSGCNTYSGSYQVDGDQVQIGPLASTMMACMDPAGLMEQETAYLQVLSSATSFRLGDSQLELLDDAGQVVLVFTETPPAAAQPPASALEAPASISQEGLESAVYRLDNTPSGVVQLTDGVYTAPAAAGSATQTRVELSDWIAYGLLPDGQTAAAVILISSGGGSGTFYHLALMADASGQAVNNATVFLGDRIVVHSLGFEEGKIVVELTRQGPEDAMCCPTQRMLEVYAYENGELGMVSSVELAQDSLTGVVWQWEEFQSSDETVVKPENPEAYTVEFLPDGKLNIQADCNRVMGTYTIDGSSLAIEALAMTKVACPPGSLSNEFVSYLNDVVSFTFQDGDLYLALKMDAGIMKFTAPASPASQSLSGVVWQWEEFQSSDETVVKPENPEAYTIEFLPDGTLAVGADCNRATGTYTVVDSLLTLQVTAMTMAACPPGSLATQFIEYLNNVVSYVFQDGNLYLALKFDSGIMKFTP